ncbi:MAG: hypothetical protein R2862_08100 [Thermoanaerobaculia bacterium]
MAEDGAGNLVVRKPATAGREKAPVVVLQSHLDMVCEKNSDVEFDFTRDALKPPARRGLPLRHRHDARFGQRHRWPRCSPSPRTGEWFTDRSSCCSPSTRRPG